MQAGGAVCARLDVCTVAGACTGFSVCTGAVGCTRLGYVKLDLSNNNGYFLVLFLQRTHSPFIYIKMV